MEWWKFVASTLYLLGAYSTLFRLNGIETKKYDAEEREMDRERPDLAMSRKESQVVRHIAIGLAIILWPMGSFVSMIKATRRWKISKPNS